MADINPRCTPVKYYCNRRKGLLLANTVQSVGIMFFILKEHPLTGYKLLAVGMIPEISKRSIMVTSMYR